MAQGDILLPTDDLRESLNVAHRWFNDPKYLGFMVISQTCDLVRRAGDLCKTPYTEIAVVRPLRPYMLALLRQQCDWIGDRYFPATERNRANELLDRVINQNEAALGLFYLHPESEIGIAEESVVLLRVSIALRSNEHYGTLMDARRGRLHPEFANKLGWLCGNLYSRVGIRDWKEDEQDKETAEAIKRRLLEDSDGTSPRFVDCPKSFLKELRQGKVDLRCATADQIEAKIAKYQSKPYKESALDAVVRVLEGQGVDAKTRAKIRNVLTSDSEFATALRPGAS
ncbi:MAG: hypothetical protein U1D55_02710 [Phycisphaerae bacterium]